ncbi:ArsC family reductase [Marinobacterium arenosum]|uniref:ArsC family reductase n=1 Tax=Marinobacterium arenosum TaxID=2862496 RepID=UPI001C97AC90|nr:ArsC family reductase [Marinobacterium arenosum]MBY4678030.1 ArsC family reductase [Marinobacterium arenosum]
MITMYGIKNCDTIKKARKWLEARGIDYRFHDYRADGLDEAQLRGWCDELGWEQLLNKRGTTWRQLPDAVKASIDGDSAIQVMLDNPAAIKRPLLDSGAQRTLGFKEAEYQTLFAE